MRFAKWLGGAVWIGSWYLMYLEITRWRHVKPRRHMRQLLGCLLPGLLTRQYATWRSNGDRAGTGRKAPRYSDWALIATAGPRESC
jgi:hypothetical protein